MTQALPPPTKPIGERINVVPPPPPPAIVQESDRVPSGRVVVTLLVATVVVAVSVVVVIALEQHPPHAPTRPAPALLHGVHQTPIAGPSYAAALRDEQERALHAAAIVDDKTGVATIPIDDAKRLYLQRHAKPEAP